MVAYLKLLYLLTICLVICYGSRIRFTNIVCNITDPKYARIDRCRLKAVSRDVQYFTAKVTVFDLPITDFSLRVQLMKRLNGWKPFLYDRTVTCNFSQHLNSLTRLGWNLVKNVTNIKHDCPFNQTFDMPYLDNIYMNNVFKLLPLPPGVYGVFTTVKTGNITRGFATFQATFE